IEEVGMDIVVRPGPQINAELTWFGYPLRVLADPELQARNAQGTPAVLTQVPRPIPALSYAAEEFFQEVALWYDAICPILAEHAYPNGRLLAAQVDNEMAYFFHVNAYAADFHPASIARYQAFLEKRYQEIDALNRAYRSEHRSFSDVEPPRRFEGRCKEDVPYYLDWAEYRERYLVDSIGRLADMMRARGLDGIALFHNYPHPLGPGGAASGFTTPFSLAGLEEKLDSVGFDLYSRKELYHHVKTVMSYVVGTSRFPYIPELIAGVWPWYLNPGDLHDEEFVAKAALMQGIKGFSRYMLVERDRWLASPVRSDGRVREENAAVFRQINELALGADLASMRRAADVLLLANRDYDRLEAASVLVSFPGDFLETQSGFSEYPNFMTVSEHPLGFEHPIQMVKAEWFAKAFDGLSEAGLAFLLSDTGTSLERWRDFRAVVVSSFEFMAGALQRKLVDFATGGGTVVLGPTLPFLDERMGPDETMRTAVRSSTPVTVGPSATTYAVGQGRIVHLSEVADFEPVLRTVLGDLDLIGFTRNDSRLDVTVHRPTDGGHRSLVFVANPTAGAITAEITTNPPVTFLHELWTERQLTPSTVLRDEIPAYTIAVYEARR
ncbi:MAG: beta-galactosidase, partial [Acidimicrobiaceae bacterium]|nr:beta-galactosidase [Acidimicrobiaceae bacterium]